MEHPSINPIYCSWYLPCYGPHGIAISAHICVDECNLMEWLAMPNSMQSHRQGIHAIRANIARHRVCPSLAVGKIRVFPVPIAIPLLLIVAAKLIFELVQLRLEVLMGLLRAHCQKLHRLHICFKIIACFFNHFLPLLHFLPIYQPNYYQCH